MSLLDLTSGQREKLSLAKRLIETLLNRVAAQIFPALLVLVSAVILLWQIGRSEPMDGQGIPIQVLEQTSESGALDQVSVLDQLQSSAVVVSHETHLSTNPHWLLLSASTLLPDSGLIVDFPSRHLTSLACWDQQSQVLLGAAKRGETHGLMVNSRGGFALQLPGRKSVSLVCRATFRGPAKISARVSTPILQKNAQKSYFKTGALIEGSLGMLATFMLLTAVINRNKLYWTFVGWLILNMRMAAISAGTDFHLFGMEIPADLLISMRQWTVCMYFAMTIALFSLLFRKELENIRSGWPLTALQATAVLFIAVGPFLAYETMLVYLWYGTTLGVLVILTYLYKIIRRQPSRMAYWYAASIAVTLIASVNEVVAAATGQRGLLAELNSVTAALTSALLVSTALAEHMRTDRIKKIEAQRTLKAAYEDSPIGLFTVSDDGALIKSNPAFQSMVQIAEPGQTTDLSHLFDAQTTRALMAVAPQQKTLELRTKVQKPGHLAPRWFAIKASTADGITIEGSLQDITDKVMATERLELLVNHDPLTECLNLRGLARGFDRAGARPTALAYFDLDRFKLINDLYGHRAGDNVLKQVCQRIRSVLRPADLLSRVGGDEFVIAFAGTALEQSHEVCKQIIHLVSTQPYKIGQQSFALGIAGGLVGTENFAKSPMEEIISAADALCGMAKKQASGRLVVRRPDDQFFQYFKDEIDVTSCLERGETPSGLFLVMQPEISLTRPFNSLNFEILVRMRKADGSVLPAAIIIGAAEAHGKTAIIDRWVITTAIEWIEANINALTNTRFASINISGGSLNDEAFIEEMFILFEKHPKAFSLTCIEITETVALTDISHVQRFIRRVHALGGKVALDDFGAGYSSFGYIKEFAVDALKLDGSLVKDAARSPAGLAIIDALGGLASSLGMKSIGEYAEDLVTIKALASAGVDYAQGYGISKPVLPERILQCHSAADFIEDTDIRAYFQQIDSGVDATMPLFDPTEVTLH